MSNSITNTPGIQPHLCECGCGQQTILARYTDKRDNTVKGTPLRFIHGHNTRNTLPVAKRFWACVDIRATNECWSWLKNTTTNGYGIFYEGKYRHVRAHRFAWELTYGPIPVGLQCCHKCDNPPCCNPAHLFLGTQADNLHDCIAKGRAPCITKTGYFDPCRKKRGTDHHNAKLTEYAVIEIRNAHEHEKLTYSALGARYHVSANTIFSVVKRKTWQHVK